MRPRATIRGAVHPAQDRLKSTRMRLHLPKRRVREELRAWLPADDIEDLSVVRTAVAVSRI
jgi:hypothetical protein